MPKTSPPGFGSAGIFLNNFYEHSINNSTNPLARRILARFAGGRTSDKELPMKTIIAWTDFTANFWMGCQKISAGCAHCYAETLTKNRMGLSVWGPPDTTSRQAVKSVYPNLKALAKTSDPENPKKVFVGSLMDWAEDHRTAAEIRPRIWDEVRRYPNLTFQLLTKRSGRIAECLPPDWGPGYPNVWLGTSVEDMRVAHRVADLVKIPAAVRFISYEPAIGPLDDLDIAGLDWIIYGGESGSNYREHDLAWPRAMRDKCKAAGVAFFFKQSSAYRTEMGTTLDGETIQQYPIPRK